MKYICIISLIIALITVALPSQAQQPTPEQVVAERVKNAEQKNYLSLSIENDLFGSGEDQHYTSGVRLTYFNVNTPIPKYLDTAATAIPTFDLNETTSTFLTLGQNLYTPENIGITAQQDHDRPWAGFLYGSVGLATLDDNHLDELEITLGVVGPEALGEQTQKFIHRHITGSRIPQGWRHQLNFEPALIIAAGRRWPRFLYKDMGDFRLNIEPNINISLGNIYTHAGGGASVTFGHYQGSLQDKPPRVPPAIPGTGFFETPDQEWSWYMFAGLNGRAVGRNIFLDGNTFSNSHSVDKRYFVGDASIGAAITLGDYRLSYSYNLRSKEFKKQDDPNAFGSLTLSARF